jgi:lipopolysaccharide export system protein LptA
VIRLLSRLLLCCAFLLTACSKRERSNAEEADWADIQPMTDESAAAALPATAEPEADTPAAPPSRRLIQSEGEDYSALIERLRQMKSVGRAAGEILITGESLVFDYERRFVRMDEDVTVVDDRGTLKTETLLGRFSEKNEVEMIEARKGVQIESAGRRATANGATYAYESGAIQLEGNAHIFEGDSRLSGGQIKFWIKGRRKMLCEPDALLEISSTSGLKVPGGAQDGEITEIRSDRLVYNEEQALAEFDGNVRVRDPRAAMNCGKVRLHLKESNEIDWIEALYEVIIQSDERKALADQANYYADEGKFVLNGDPKVMEGRNIMTGDRIIFWHESRRMVCEPNARALLFPDEDMKAKFMKDLKD